jgi:hypothetical protein
LEQTLNEFNTLKSGEDYEQLIVDCITIVCHETGWSIEEVLDMGITQLFSFTKNLNRLYENEKNKSEFLGRLNGVGKTLV